MLGSPRVMVVSAFGRGHWIAVELQRLGFNVQLVDVSHRLGLTSPADQEGPFGYFISPRWQRSEINVLDSFGEVRVEPRGLSVWLRNGPWELHSPLTKYRAETLKQQERALHFVQHYSDLEIDRKLWIEKLSHLDFERRWIASLSSDLLANRSQWAEQAFAESVPAPILERYLTRPPETRSHEEGLRWCAEQGVVVIEKANVPDLAIEGRKIQGVEVDAERSGFVRCHQLLWTLTSSETEFLSKRVFTKIYQDKAMEPEWCWMRYQLEFADAREVSLLPNEFLLIDELTVPWSHDNFVLFRRSHRPRLFHVWIRLPNSQRFHREYLSERIKPVIEKLKSRCSRLEAHLRELPLEAEANSRELGAPHFPIYRAEDLAHPPGIKLKNLWFSHAERWPSYAWSHIFDSQDRIISELRDWWSNLNDEQKNKELQL